MNKARKAKLEYTLKTNMILWKRYRRFTKYKTIDLSEILCFGHNFKDCNFDNVNLQNAYFSTCTFTNCSFVFTNFESADFQDCEFTNCIFKNANTRKFDWNNSRFENCNLDFAQLDLSCNTLSMIIDEKIAKQISYHLLRLLINSEIEEPKLIEELIKYTKDTHLITEHQLKKFYL
jgi:hypothetical protein